MAVENKLMLRNVRLSFPTLGEPEQYQNKGPFRWSAAFLVPYNDPQKAAVDKLIRAIAIDKWGKKADNVLETVLTDPKGCCWMDGKRKDYEGYEGHFALSTHRPQDKGRPMVIDTDKSPIYMPDNTLYAGKAGRVYGGCYVNAQVEIWTQDNKQGKGVRATMLTIQRNRDGDSFGGGARPSADDFGEVEEGADAADIG
jgi:hypothetical protein